MRSELIDDGSAGVSIAEQLRDFIVSFTRGIVARLADVLIAPACAVIPALLAQIKMSMSAGDDEGQQGKLKLAASFLLFFQQDGVDVAFQVIHRNDRLVFSEGECLRVSNTYKKRAGKP